MAPRFTPGDRSSVLCWRPKRTETVETVSAASVRGHIWTGLIRVNAFLQFYFAGPSRPPQLLERYGFCSAKFKRSRAKNALRFWLGLGRGGPGCRRRPPRDAGLSA